MSDLAATGCGCSNTCNNGGFLNGGGNCSCSIILILLILSCACGGEGGFLGGSSMGGCGNDSCGCGNILWIIILIALIG